MVVIAILILQTGFAQNDITKAFEKSYTNETNQEYQKAIDNLLSVYDASSYSLNLRLGWLHYLNMDYNKSKTYYDNAIKLQKNSIEARLGLAYPVYAMNNVDNVIDIYKDILSIDPNNAKANYRLASIYYTRKSWDEVERYALSVLKLYPFDYDTNLLLGSAYIKNGKIKEAKKVLQKALEYNPTSQDVLSLLEAL